MVFSFPAAACAEVRVDRPQVAGPGTAGPDRACGHCELRVKRDALAPGPPGRRTALQQQMQVSTRAAACPRQGRVQARRQASASARRTLGIGSSSWQSSTWSERARRRASSGGAEAHWWPLRQHLIGLPAAGCGAPRFLLRGLRAAITAPRLPGLWSPPMFAGALTSSRACGAGRCTTPGDRGLSAQFECFKP